MSTDAPRGATSDAAPSRSEQRFRSIIDGFADPLLTIDEHQLVRYANAAMHRALRYGPADVLARPFGVLLHAEERAAVEARLAAAIASEGVAALIEHRLLRADGAWELGETTPNHLDDPLGRPLLVLHLRSVTERRRLEAQLLQRQKMELVGQLAGGVAHDFNNLLTVINGTAELALEAEGRAVPPARSFATILEAGRRAARLTQQLLAFGSKLPTTPESVDLDDVVARFAPMLTRLIGEQIRVFVRRTADLGHIRADPTQLDQILLNLAVNARDAMPDGGSLTIETANVLLDADYARGHHGVTPGPHVLLAVTDTGCGMDEATRARIFEPFFTTKGPGKGSGLGLATVYGIVKQLGGEIWCYSEPRQGTSFKVYFPRTDGAVSVVRAEAAAAASHGSETVLVVDDDEGLRQVAARILETHGYRVLVAASGAEALWTMARHRSPIHLLLTDVVMPEMSGVELARQVRDGHPHVKVLFATGYTEDSVGRRGVLADGADVVVKPYALRELPRRVRQALDA